ncbi:glucoamylase family protein [Lacipirellula sp.]|uniref:glucoamylase family protein n=1 Tax=Lacipirellula sp. TaxID=2691419 RepID=UPI003D143301
MPRLLRWSLIGYLLVVVAGCAEKQTPAKAPPAPTTNSAKAKAAAATAKKPPEVEVAEAAKAVNDDNPGAKPAAADARAADKAKPTAEARPEPAKKETAKLAESAKESANAPPSPPPPPERIAILTPGGPLLVDVTMTLDGRPFNEAFEARIDALLTAADSDGNGEPTWKELLDNKAYFEEQSPGRPEMSAREQREAIDEYDLNEDAHVDRREAAKWLGRDGRTPAAAFKIRSSRAYVPNARTTSRVWQFLDRDGDGELSAAELTGAGQALIALDADDDQSLTMAELATLREQLIGQNGGASDESTRDAAMHLQPGYVIERLDYLLPDLYSSHQALSPASFASLPKLFAQLDKSGEEWLDRDELDRLRTIDPHLRIKVDFATATGDRPMEAGTAAVTLVDHQAELKTLGTPPAGRLDFDLGGTRLAFSATDASGANFREMGGNAAAERDQIELFVHDREDALFELIDANGDGRLGAREMAMCRERLSARDANGDGALAAGELPYAMIVAFVRGATGGDDQFFLPPRVAAPQENKAPSWFRAADFNGDGDVSRREFLGSPEKFAELDGDGNGFIDAHEAVEATPAAPVSEEAPESTNEVPVPVDANSGIDYEFTPSDIALLDEIQRGCFNYFWNEIGEPSGLAKDRRTAQTASIAGVGFQLASLPIGVSRGWISREEGEARAIKALKALRERREVRREGVYFHFVEANSGGVYVDFKNEASTVDHALLLAGAMTAASAFPGEATRLVDEIGKETNWRAFIDPSTGFLSMGWQPVDNRSVDGPGKLIPSTWQAASDEERLIYFLATGAENPSYAMPAEVYYRLKREFRSHRDQTPFIASPSGTPFTYFFSHCWIDYRRCGVDDPQRCGVEAPGVDWFENSRQALAVHRSRCLELATTYKTFGNERWGVSPCMGFENDRETYLVQVTTPNLAERDDWRGGVIAPYAAGCSIMFTPAESLAAMRAFRDLKDGDGKPLAWRDPSRGGYGFVDSFSLAPPRACDDNVAIDAGPLLIAIENARSGLVWKLFKEHPVAKRASEQLQLRPFDS